MSNLKKMFSLILQGGMESYKLIGLFISMIPFLSVLDAEQGITLVKIGKHSGTEY